MLSFAETTEVLGVLDDHNNGPALAWLDVHVVAAMLNMVSLQEGVSRQGLVTLCYLESVYMSCVMHLFNPWCSRVSWRFSMHGASAAQMQHALRSRPLLQISHCA